MTEKERKRYIDYMLLKDELEEEMNQGYALAFDGREADASEIARACVFREETSYMRDYNTSHSGRNRTICFGKVYD